MKIWNFPGEEVCAVRHLSDLISKGQLCPGCTHPSMHLHWFSYTLVQEACALGVHVADSRQLLALDHCR